jgi:hypothetical protein
MLDEDCLEEALRLSSERTYSAVVNLALAEFVRRVRAGRILELAGSGMWEGDLSQMRGDFAVNEPKRKRRRRGTR